MKNIIVGLFSLLFFATATTFADEITIGFLANIPTGEVDFIGSDKDGNDGSGVSVSWTHANGFGIEFLSLNRDKYDSQKLITGTTGDFNTTIYGKTTALMGTSKWTGRNEKITPYLKVSAGIAKHEFDAVTEPTNGQTWPLGDTGKRTMVAEETTSAILVLRLGTDIRASNNFLYGIDVGYTYSPATSYSMTTFGKNTIGDRKFHVRHESIIVGFHLNYEFQ